MCGLSPFGQVRYTEKRCILAFLLGVHIRIYLTPPQLHLRNNEKPVFSIMNHSQTLDLHLAGVRQSSLWEGWAKLKASWA